MLNFLKANGKKWVVSQRETNRINAESLRHEEKTTLEIHFDPKMLENVRVQKVSQIENPYFYASFEKVGQPIPLDFRQMRGITFIDTILIAEPKVAPENWLSLLFHECVHVCQYDILGVDTFIDRYIDGWANNGFNYASIPLERVAYDLQREFESSPQSTLSVESEVRRRLGE